MGDKGERDLAAELGSKALAGVVGGAIGGPPGVLAGVALEPLLRHLVTESWQEIGALRQRSVGLMVQDAANRLELPVDQLIERAWSSQERVQLFADAMVQAAQTFNEQKIRALGRAVANGLCEDEARPDEERLIVAALAAVEEAHIKVLLSLPDRRSRPTVSSTGIRQRMTSRRGQSLWSVAEEAHLSPHSAEHVLAELIRTGMASADVYASDTRHDKLIIELQEEITKLQKILENPTKRVTGSNKPKRISKPGRLPEPGYALTPFGRTCLLYLQDLDPEPEDDLMAEDRMATVDFDEGEDFDPDADE